MKWINLNKTHSDQGNWKSSCGRWAIKPRGERAYRFNKHNDLRLVRLFVLIDSRGEFDPTLGLVGELKKKAIQRDVHERQVGVYFRR